MNYIETKHQIALVDWARKKKQIADLLYHPANGGKRNKREAAKLKRMGVLAGVPDLFLSFPAKSLHGLYLELKREDGGRLYKSQREFIARVRDVGYGAEVIRSVDEGIEILEWYLNE